MENLKTLLRELYPQQYQELYRKLIELIGEGKRVKGLDWKKNWHKNFSLYVTYPDSFSKNGISDLNVLADKIEYIDELGVDAVHILPFFKSPMIDAGFDVSDYMHVRESLGGDEALKKVIKKVKEKKMKLFIDLVLNHVSTEHEWFKKAVKGDSYYKDFFIYSEKKPNFIRRYKDESGVWGEYDYHENADPVRARIIFPEQVGEIPHWYNAEDGNWYYHTFYPSQIDTNWDNPNLFYEFAKTLVYWARKGVSFRLDAFTYVGKDIKNGRIESTEKTTLCLEALHQIVRSVSIDSVFLVETCQDIQTIKRYFGDKDSPKAELAYNFPLMNALWMSILLSDPKYVKKVVKESYTDLPCHAAWITFLRNHDELTLEYCPKEMREQILSKLKDKGLNFREGFGLSGRIASFFDSNNSIIFMAYALLASLPGNPAIIYGDEIGKVNDYDFMKKKTEEKRKLDKDVQDDTRDINRGVITEEEIIENKAQALYMSIAEMLRVRTDHSSFFCKIPTFINCDNKSLLGLEYSSDGKPNESVCVYINLSDQKAYLDLFINPQVILKINNVRFVDSKIELDAYSGVWVKL